MDETSQQYLLTILATALTLSVVGGVAILAGAGTVAADQHNPEDAPTYSTIDGGVNFTIALPEQTDHYPGNHPVHSEQNGYNASIEYFATGERAFTDQNAEEGLWLDFIEVGAEWIDYSQCDATQNTKVFGLDRGSDNQGTNIDEDLIEHRRSSELGAGGLTVTFFDWDDLSGDPPYISPEDAVVAAQGVGSNDGPCLKMTSEPGWYQVRGFTNGTIATGCTEEGDPSCEPENKEFRGVNLLTNYVYICECDGEGAAREQLGPPPNEDPGDGDSDDAATPTPTPEPETTPTPTPEPETTPTPTATAEQGGDDQQNDGGQQNDGNNQQNDGGQGNDGGQQNDGTNQQNDGGQRNDGGGQTARATPTIGEGPGFGPLVALGALLGATLLLDRRD
jgi:PGF-CTERM protein